MATLIHADGGSGAVFWDSSGEKYAVFIRNTFNIDIYSDVDGTPTQETTVSAQTAHGTTTNFNIYIDAAIDSADKIHVMSFMRYNPAVENPTRDVAYRVYNPGTSSWEGSWEEVVAPENVDTTEIYAAGISLDSNDVPHVIYNSRPKHHGTEYHQVYYINRVGGSWGTPEAVSATPNANYGDQMMISHAPSDAVEVLYYHEDNDDVCYRRRNTLFVWGTENTYNHTMGQPNQGRQKFGLGVTTGDTVYRYYIDNSQNIYENGVDVGWNATLGNWLSGLVAPNGTRLIFYEGGSPSDIYVRTNSGSGWVNQGSLNDGTAPQANRRYHNHNSGNVIPYLFSNSGLYYDEYNAGPTIDMDAFRWRNDNGSETTATWKAATNANPTFVTGDYDTNMRLRVLLQAAVDDTIDGYRWAYSINDGTWTPITTSSSYVRAVTSGNVTDGDPTTQQIGAGTHDEGDIDTTGVIASFTLTSGQESENELVFQLRSADFSATDKLEIRLEYDDGTPLTTYTNIPTIASMPAPPTATFEQAAFRIRTGGDSGDAQGLNDNGAGDWAAALNTNATLDASATRHGVVFGLRFRCLESAGIAGTLTPKIRVQKNGTGGFVDMLSKEHNSQVNYVAGDSIEVGVFPTDRFTDGLATTNLLGGTGFVAGSGEHSNQAVGVSLNNQTTE
jgi:hypothetical protein